MADATIKVSAGSAVIFGDAGKSDEDVEISLTSLADGSGRISARYDLGASPREARVLIYAEFQAVATPTLGDTLAVYVAWHTEDGDAQGGVGTVDAALTDDKARNLDFVGLAVCDAASANTVFTMGPVEIPVKGRYISLGVINDFGAALTSDDEENFLKLYTWPLYADEA